MRLLSVLFSGRQPSDSGDRSTDEPPSTDLDDTDNIDAQAILWHVRLRDGGAKAQTGFADWLKADPRHAKAFASITSTKPEWDGIASDSREYAQRRPLHYGRWSAGGAVTIALVASLTIGTLGRSDPYEVETRPGDRRVVTLESGTRVTLNGGTKLRLDHRNTRVATLLFGEAVFDVRHDAAHPFRLTVLDRTIEDVGTIFNVAAENGEVRVGVAEGSVLYNPDGEKISLQAGQGLVDAHGRRQIRLVETPTESVGGWRRGQFVYAGQPLAQVAADLSRTLGVGIVASSAIAARPFTGAIVLRDARPARTTEELRRVATALDVRAERTANGWLLKPGTGAVR